MNEKSSRVVAVQMGKKSVEIDLDNPAYGGRSVSGDEPGIQFLDSDSPSVLPKIPSFGMKHPGPSKNPAEGVERFMKMMFDDDVKDSKRRSENE